MKEQTSWPPVFLLLRFYGNGGKQKSHKNACIGFVKFKKKREEFVMYLTVCLCKSFDWTTENFASGRNFAIGGSWCYMMTYNTEVILYRQLRTVKTMPARFQTSGSQLII